MVAHGATAFAQQLGQLALPLLLGVGVEAALRSSGTWELAAIAAGFAASSVVIGLSQCAEIRVWTQIAAICGHALRSRVANRLVTLGEDGHQANPLGASLAQTTSVVDGAVLTIDAVTTSAGILGVVLLAAGALALADPVMLAMLGVLLVSGAVAAARAGQTLRAASMNLYARRESVAATVHDTMAGVRVLKGFGVEEGAERRCRFASEQLMTQGIEFGRLEANFRAKVDALPMLGVTMLFVLAGLWLTLQDHESPPPALLVAVVAWVPQTAAIGRTLAMLQVAFHEGLAAIDRLGTVLEADGGILDDGVEALSDLSRPPRIEFKSVGVSRGERVILSDVSFTVDSGETLAVTGESGSGKSTLLSLLPRVRDPTGGAVLLGARDLRSIPLRDLRRYVAWAPQPVPVLPASVWDNVGLHVAPSASANVRSAARRATFADVLSRLPRGWATQLGRRAHALSGGERQLLGVARALAPRAFVLLLDDITTSLDPHREAALATRLIRELRGRTAIVVTSRPVMLRVANRILVLDEGRVVDVGTFEELERRCPQFRRIILGSGDAA